MNPLVKLVINGLLDAVMILITAYVNRYVNRYTRNTVLMAKNRLKLRV